MGRDSVQEHPQLAQIVSALLDGRPCSEIAQEYGLEKSAVHLYAKEAGLLQEDPEPSVPEPDTLERKEQPTLGPERIPEAPRQPVSSAAHERQVLEEGARRRGQPAGQRPDPEKQFSEDRQRGLQELLRASLAEEQAYAAQPIPAIGARLREDPLGQVGFELHVGIQPASRLLALGMRDRTERAEKVWQWYAADVFRWRQPPPDDL